MAVPPTQIVGEFTVITRAPATVTVAVAVPVQPKVVPTTVYVVVVAGETI